MKYFAIALFMLAAPGLSFAFRHPAQPVPALRPVKLVYYEIEGRLFFEISGCVPGSDIAFYSDRGGGRILKTVGTDAQGNALVETDTDFKPAFVLNLSSENKAGIAGSGMVSFVEEKLFAIRQLRLTRKAGQIKFSWEGSAQSPDLVFEVLRSNGGPAAATVNREPALKSPAFRPYATLDAEMPEGAVYQLRIIDRKENKSYFTRQLSAGKDAAFSRIYPTVVAGRLTVQLSANALPVQYQVLDNSGRVFVNGIFSQVSQSLQLSLLPAGVYFLKLKDVNGCPETGRIVKE